MKCSSCGASGYGLHHSAACKYLNVDIYEKTELLEKQRDLLTLGLLQEKGKVGRLEEALDTIAYRIAGGSNAKKVAVQALQGKEVKK